MKLITIDFPFTGPFGDDMAKALHDLAADIAQETGLIWKIWTENAAEQRAGGVYAFENDTVANAYIAKHTTRLQNFGIPSDAICVQSFDVNVPLSKIDRAPI